MNAPASSALILSGGGARGAYQVGVLKAIAELLPADQRNPFSIICGTSAGALNAATLASHCQQFQQGVQSLVNTWSHLEAKQVFRTELGAFAWMLLRWLIPGITVGYTPTNSALLDDTPLRDLLSIMLKPAAIQEAIDTGDLKALCITASSYGNGESVTFFQAARNIAAWDRVRRLGQPAIINVDHLMASSAIPLLFPAQRIGEYFYGDGAVRQLAPLSPAIHLGANKLLVIGVSANTLGKRAPHAEHYPSMAKVLGHLLNSVFIDTLEGDVERLERINDLLATLSAEECLKRSIQWRPVDVLKIYPSEHIDEIAERHLNELPASLRFFLRGSGATAPAGASAISYLLFHPGFCQELIQLGYKDGMAKRDELHAFFAGA